ncbi:Pyruvate dehydrogenase E1 component [Burkholderia cenocepacia]|nr:Pyruvate dehydrogenase E1 component [Burkholderia cenocepacia]
MRTSACAPWPAPGDEENSGMATRSDSAGFHRIAILPYGPRNRMQTRGPHRSPSRARSFPDLSGALQRPARPGNTLSFFFDPVLCIMTYLLQHVLIQGAGKSLSVQGGTARVQAGMRTGFACLVRGRRAGGR